MLPSPSVVVVRRGDLFFLCFFLLGPRLVLGRFFLLYFRLELRRHAVVIFLRFVGRRKWKQFVLAFVCLLCRQVGRRENIKSVRERLDILRKLLGGTENTNPALLSS